MPGTIAFPPLGGDLFLPLVDRLDEAEPARLRSAPVLTPEQRVAVTMLALGECQHHVSVDLDLSPYRLQELLRSAARRLHPPGGGVPALVNAAYWQPAFPAPALETANPPELGPVEREALHAHTLGMSLRHLQRSRQRPRHEVGTAHQYLPAKLQARTTAHAIRRAWQFGILHRLVPHSAPPAHLHHRRGYFVGVMASFLNPYTAHEEQRAEAQFKGEGMVSIPGVVRVRCGVTGTRSESCPSRGSGR